MLYSGIDESSNNCLQISVPCVPISVIFFFTNCFAVSRGSSKFGCNIVVSRLQSKMWLKTLIDLERRSKKIKREYNENGTDLTQYFKQLLNSEEGGGAKIRRNP